MDDLAKMSVFQKTQPYELNAKLRIADLIMVSSVKRPDEIHNLVESKQNEIYNCSRNLRVLEETVFVIIYLKPVCLYPLVKHSIGNKQLLRKI